MSVKVKNLTGKKFNHWTVLSQAGTINNKIYWNCVCDCKNKIKQKVRADRLKNGCCKGCRNCVRPITHDMTGTPTYISWQKMKDRCYNKNSDYYNRYGKNGIKVCKRWLGEKGFENFLKDMGIRPNNTTLDRFPISNGNYTPKNTRWATKKEQSRNRISTKLNEKLVSKIRKEHKTGKFLNRELAKKYGVSITSITLITNNKTWKSDDTKSPNCRPT